MHLSPRQPVNTFSKDLPLNTYSRGMGALGLPGDLSSSSRLQRPVAFSIMGLKEKEYLLLTLNKHSLLNKDTTLKAIFRTILEKTDKPIVAPLHTYVKNKLSALGITSERLYILPPQPYLSFGYLVNHAWGIITDSGNVAEEATFLGIPCMTLSTYAEHPETVTIGTNRLVGENSEILADALDILNKGEWQKGHLPERWDGTEND